MSLLCLACNCGNSTPLLRSFLQSNGVPDYMNIPLLKGDKAKQWAKEHALLPDLSAYLEKVSAFAIIVGRDFDEGLYDWVDINHQSLAHKAKAAELIKTFLV